MVDSQAKPSAWGKAGNSFAEVIKKRAQEENKTPAPFPAGPQRGSFPALPSTTSQTVTNAKTAPVSPETSEKNTNARHTPSNPEPSQKIAGPSILSVKPETSENAAAPLVKSEAPSQSTGKMLASSAEKSAASTIELGTSEAPYQSTGKFLAVSSDRTVPPVYDTSRAMRPRNYDNRQNYSSDWADNRQNYSGNYDNRQNYSGNYVRNQPDRREKKVAFGPTETVVFSDREIPGLSEKSQSEINNVRVPEKVPVNQDKLESNGVGEGDMEEEDDGGEWQTFEKKSQRRVPAVRSRGSGSYRGRRPYGGAPRGAFNGRPPYNQRLAASNGESRQSEGPDANHNGKPVETKFEQVIEKAHGSEGVVPVKPELVAEKKTDDVQSVTAMDQPVQPNESAAVVIKPIDTVSTASAVPIVPAWSGPLPPTIKPAVTPEPKPTPPQVLSPDRPVVVQPASKLISETEKKEPSTKSSSQPEPTAPVAQPEQPKSTVTNPPVVRQTSVPQQSIPQPFVSGDNLSQKKPEPDRNDDGFYGGNGKRDVSSRNLSFNHDAQYGRAHRSEATFYPQPSSTATHCSKMTEVPTRNGSLFVNPLLYPAEQSALCYPAQPEEVPVRNGTQSHNGNPYSEWSQGIPSHYSPQEEWVQEDPGNSVTKSYGFQADLAGILIGRSGSSIQELRQRFICDIWIDDPVRHDTSGVSILHIQGREDCVDLAADRIRSRLRAYNCDLQPVIGPSTNPDTLKPFIPKLELAPGVVMQCYISHVDRNGILFVQLPSHPTFTKLAGLERHLPMHCSDPAVSSLIDTRSAPLQIGSYVAAPAWAPMTGPLSMDASGMNPLAYHGHGTERNGAVTWLRAVVVTGVDDEGKMGLRSLDHGFSFTALSTSLRFLAPDFCTVPLQAIECRVLNGKYREDLSLEEQLIRQVNPILRHQWVKVKMVAQVMNSTNEQYDWSSLEYSNLDQPLPVVEMWVSSSLPPVAPNRAQFPVQ